MVIFTGRTIFLLYLPYKLQIYRKEKILSQPFIIVGMPDIRAIPQWLSVAFKGLFHESLLSTLMDCVTHTQNAPVEF